MLLFAPVGTYDGERVNRGVDRIDQLGRYYKVGRRYCKWWKRVIRYCIECSLGNGYVLDRYVRPDEHACKGRMKRDFFGVEI